jgi:hypothetical protein
MTVAGGAAAATAAGGGSVVASCVSAPCVIRCPAMKTAATADTLMATTRRGMLFAISRFLLLAGTADHWSADVPAAFCL